MDAVQSRTLHSGAGRIATIQMRTMSLYESGESTGAVRLSNLFDDGMFESNGESSLSYDDLVRIIVRGGWPEAVINGLDDGEVVSYYCEAVLNSEIFIDRKRRNRRKLEMLLRSLSRNVSTGASNRTILADITPDDEMPDGGEVGDSCWSESSFVEGSNPPMGIDTLRSYLEALEAISIVEDMPAWEPKLRSRTQIRTSDTRYVSDPSIAAHFLNATANYLVMDPDTFGLLFENLVIRDLRVYAQAIGGKVMHYRDKTGLEVDAIVHLNNGRWGAIEIKLSDKRVDEGVRSLIRLKEKVDEGERNKLSFLAVITGTGYAYTRSDGVHVVPIGCLRN